MGVALAINASAGAPAYAARDYRNAAAALKAWDGVAVAGRQGIRPMGGSAANIVTLSGSTITVNPHAGEVTPGWSAVTGTYDVALTAVETHTLTPADATNARKDIVVGRVYDHDESPSGLRLYRSEYIAGVAGPGPSEPAVPTGAVRLATIDVPQSGGGSPTVTNNYQLTAATGGILPVRSATERAAISNPYDGYAIYRIDRDWVEIHDGTAWRVVGVPYGSSIADLTSAVTSPRTGQLGYITTGALPVRWSGSAWVPIPALGEFAPPALSGSGTFSSGTQLIIATVNITDPGYSYYIHADGAIGWTVVAANIPGRLIEGAITVDSTVYNTNRMCAGFEVSQSVGAGFTQPTLVVPHDRSDRFFPAFTGPHTVRLIARNTSTPAADYTIPAAAVDTKLNVRIVPA